MYGAKYSYNEVRVAEDTVCQELNDPLPARESVLDVLSRDRQERHMHSKSKRNEPDL